MTHVERSRQAVPILRRIFHELRRAEPSWRSAKSEECRFIMGQARDHRLTQRILNKAPNEIQHLASTYATYLESGRRLAEVQKKYSCGERSIEESANLVGLRLPEKNNSL